MDPLPCCLIPSQGDNTVDTRESCGLPEIGGEYRAEVGASRWKQSQPGPVQAWPYEVT